MKEMWKDIEGYENRYIVSSFGKVKSMLSNKILSESTDSNGRKGVALYIDKYNKKTYRIHRLVAKAFIPNPENKPQVNHIDSNPSNNKVDNLEWCTISENMKHAYKYGNKETGENHLNTTLSEVDVLEIRAFYPFGCFTQKEIAEAYSVDSSTISNIVNNKTWIYL